MSDLILSQPDKSNSELASKLSLQELLIELNRRTAQEVIEAKEEAKRAAKLSVENADEITSLREDLKKNYEKQSYIKDRVYSNEYVNRTNLGKNNNPKISGRMMTMLMRWAGIIQQYSGEPYAQFFEGVNPICIREKFILDNGYEDFKIHFHQERTWKRIHSELDKSGLVEEFYQCKSYDEMKEFIQELS